MSRNPNRARPYSHSTDFIVVRRYNSSSHAMFPLSSSNRASPQHIQLQGPAPLNNSAGGHQARRVLRPRTEPRSYVESPDVLINGSLDRPRTNGNADFSSSESSDGEEMPPLAPIKELSPSELMQR